MQVVVQLTHNKEHTVLLDQVVEVVLEVVVVQTVVEAVEEMVQMVVLVTLLLDTNINNISCINSNIN